MTLVSVMAFGQSEIQGDKPEEMEEFAQGYELADVDALPGFPGGPAKRSEFIKDHLRIPFGKEGCKNQKLEVLL